MGTFFLVNCKNAKSKRERSHSSQVYDAILTNNNYIANLNEKLHIHLSYVNVGI